MKFLRQTALVYEVQEDFIYDGIPYYKETVFTTKKALHNRFRNTRPRLYKKKLTDDERDFMERYKLNILEHTKRITEQYKNLKALVTPRTHLQTNIAIDYYVKCGTLKVLNKPTHNGNTGTHYHFARHVKYVNNLNEVVEFFPNVQYKQKHAILQLMGSASIDNNRILLNWLNNGTLCREHAVKAGSHRCEIVFNKDVDYYDEHFYKGQQFHTRADLFIEMVGARAENWNRKDGNGVMSTYKKWRDEGIISIERFH